MLTLIDTAPRFAVRAAWAVLLAAGMFGIPLDAHGGETDQYLTWDVELADSAPVFNAYLDAEIHAFVDKMNRRNRKVDDAVALTEELYRYLFAGLHASRVRNWLKNAESVDRYPGDELSDWDYQRMSIFREPAFPFILPMAQTIRVGDVYFGIDKIGHMFGFGRRYLQRYQRFRAEGDGHDAAVERVLTWGVRHELSFVGKLVDGVFSNGDLEANYQGLRLALTLSAGADALFYQDGGRWRYRGGIDIREYITPDFDESFNTNDYAPWRGRRVLPIVEERYLPRASSAEVEARFARYRQGYTPSASKRFVDAWFEAPKAPERIAAAQY